LGEVSRTSHRKDKIQSVGGRKKISEHLENGEDWETAFNNSLDGSWSGKRASRNKKESGRVLPRGGGGVD